MFVMIQPLGVAKAIPLRDVLLMLDGQMLLDFNEKIRKSSRITAFFRHLKIVWTSMQWLDFLWCVPTQDHIAMRVKLRKESHRSLAILIS